MNTFKYISRSILYWIADNTLILFLFNFLLGWYVPDICKHYHISFGISLIIIGIISICFTIFFCWYIPKRKRI